MRKIVRDLELGKPIIVAAICAFVIVGGSAAYNGFEPGRDSVEVAKVNGDD